MANDTQPERSYPELEARIDAQRAADRVEVNRMVSILLNDPRVDAEFKRGLIEGNPALAALVTAPNAQKR